MNKVKKILIAGGSGFIGQHLALHLTKKGYAVSLLGRKSSNPLQYNYYSWNPAQGSVDHEAIKGKDVIINLSGAGIADRLWTQKRKDFIYQSRIDSTSLLVNTIMEQGYSPTLFINASAIGYYGNRPHEQLTESSSPGTGFVADTCIDWENEAARLSHIGIPTAILRIGIVLGENGGSLSKLISPLRYGMNILFAHGHHMMSWIHIIDLVRIVEQLVAVNLHPDIYNAVTPNALPQKTFNSNVLNLLHKKAIKINIPNALLRLAIGDLATVITADLNIQPRNLLYQKFTFSFPDIQSSLAHLLSK